MDADEESTMLEDTVTPSKFVFVIYFIRVQASTKYIAVVYPLKC